MSTDGLLFTLKCLLFLLCYTSLCIMTDAQQNVPSRGLYFTLNGNVYVPGQSVSISDLGEQPPDRSDAGSTLVCVTTNVNTECCRGIDNFGGGFLGQWYYPNGEIVGPSYYGYIYRLRYYHQVRLANMNSMAMGPFGVYTCVVPDENTGANVTAMINITSPVPTGLLTTSPKASEFYSGLMLNITCFINLNSLPQMNPDVFIEAMWTKSSSVLSNTIQRVIIPLYSTTSTTYQTILQFNSLDKTADQGIYTCTANVNVSYSSHMFSTNIILSQYLAIPTIFIQLRLSGISDCQEWKVLDAASKNSDITSAVVEFMQNNCDCEFTLDRLTDGAFLCDSTSPQSVIYQAQLHGTRQATTTELAEDLQNWAMSGSTVVVHFTVLTITNLCFLQSLSPHASCEEKNLILTTVKNELPRGASSAVIGVSVAIPIFLLLAVVVIILVVGLILMKRLRKHNSNATAESK